VLAKELSVRLTSWMPNDYSEARDHDHELEWYLWFEGREAYRLFDYGPSDLIPAHGYFGDQIQPMIYPRVVNNRFKVRLVAIERDGPQWLDPDDRAKDEFTIDLDQVGPYSTWTIVAKGPNTDLNVQVSFDILSVAYVNAPEIPKPGDPGIDDTTNFPFPWHSEIKVFEHDHGLGRQSRLDLTANQRVSRRELWAMPFGSPGTLKRSVQDTYRFGVADIGIANDTMSSLYLPKLANGRYSITVYNHDFGDARFAQSEKRTLSSPGLYKLSDFGLGDRVSAVEVVHTYPKTSPSRPPA
jgi:hypothetical protein